MSKSNFTDCDELPQVGDLVYHMYQFDVPVVDCVHLHLVVNVKLANDDELPLMRATVDVIDTSGHMNVLTILTFERLFPVKIFQTLKND